jgi:hypothetical protein
VYVPDYPLKDDKRAVTKEKNRVQKFMRNVRASEDLGDVKWLTQEYVPSLGSVGELRFFCVNGQPVRMVITGENGRGKPDAGGTWSIEGMRTMLSLKQIK